ncbi:MAG TPA: hypothetical protein VK545_21135 [Streptomyces sp.]|nr:hypothetical protein [Streptomyces sp.]
MVTTVAFARDNGTAITSGRDGTVRVWGPADRTRPAGQAALTGLTGGIAAVFSLGAPGAIVTLSHDRTIEIWNTDPSWALAHACRHVRAPLSRAQWSRHFPALDYRPPCPAGRG